MYYDSWTKPPLPGGSYANHTAHTVFQKLFSVATTVDLVLQLYCMLLMLRVSTSLLNEYRRLMFLCATWDMCFAATLGVAFQPHPFAPLFPCASARGPVAKLGNEGARITVVLLYAFGVALIVSQYYCLLYRLTTVVENQAAKRVFLKPTSVVVCLFVLVGVVATTSYAVALSTHKDDGEFYHFYKTNVGVDHVRNNESWSNLMTLLRGKEYTSDDDIAIMCFNFWDTMTPRIHFALAATYTLSQIVFVAVGVWIIRKVGRLATSEKSRKMHLQLTIVLLLQMLCPMICIFLPVVYLAASAFANAALEGYYSLVSIYVSLFGLVMFPALNATITITFIGPYRKFTVAWMRSIFKGNFGNSERWESTVSPTRAELHASHACVRQPIRVSPAANT